MWLVTTAFIAVYTHYSKHDIFHCITVATSEVGSEMKLTKWYIEFAALDVQGKLRESGRQWW